MIMSVLDFFLEKFKNGDAGESVFQIRNATLATRVVAAIVFQCQLHEECTHHSLVGAD